MSGTPAKTLERHVVEGTFRPNRHTRLLDTPDSLPVESPRPDVVELWAELRLLAAGHAASHNAVERRQLAHRFATAALELAGRLRSSRLTLTQLLHATIGPGRAPAGVSATAWARVERKWRAWDAVHGAQWRLANGVQTNTPQPTRLRAQSAPDPPGFDML